MLTVSTETPCWPMLSSTMRRLLLCIKWRCLKTGTSSSCLEVEVSLDPVDYVQIVHLKILLMHSE